VQLKIAQEWLTQNQLDFLHITGVGYGNSKAFACTGVDIFVDDDSEKLEELVTTVPYRFLFGEQEHNQTSDHDIINPTKNIAHTWKEFLEKIQNL